MLFRLSLPTTIALVYLASYQVFAQSEKPETIYADASDIIFSLEKVDQPYQAKKTAIFSASAELGFLYLTGNTHSRDFKTGVNFRFEQGLWSNSLNANLLVKKTEVENEVSPGQVVKNFNTTEQKWKIEAKTKYFINSITQNYIYGDISYEEDRFSGFDSQSSVSSGWGRRWYETKNTSIFADIGPGFKRDVEQKSTDVNQENSDMNSQNSLILQAQVTLIKKITEHIRFEQFAGIKQAIKRGNNSVYEANSSLTSRLIESLQVKISFNVTYNSIVKEELENLNTETSVLLVYNF
jgi:putative salt-induced outer membrane protein YdiY